MRILTRDFTKLEKLVLLVLILLLMGLGYYQFVDQPIRRGIEEAHAERDKLQVELNVINIRISDYNYRAQELEAARELRQPMPSYNASEEEIAILNSILYESNDYSFNVDKITLNGDQIRRAFTLNFTAPNFETAKGIFTRLSVSRIRCLIGNIDCSGIDVEDGNVVNVKADGVFYETKVHSVMDAALEEVIAAQSEAQAET